MELFITGIDTGIGKTFVTRGLALAYEHNGKNVGVYKPFQSGAIKTPSGLLAPDLEEIKKFSDEIKTKCTYLLEGEVSPALAARIAGIKPDINKIIYDFKEFSASNDVTLVEGAGGLTAPVTDDFLCSDLIKALNIPVIVVTVPALGRLNHTLLTVYCAKYMNINLKGIIINKVPLRCDDDAVKNFSSELKMYTDVPVLGSVYDSEQITKEKLFKAFQSIV